MIEINGNGLQAGIAGIAEGPLFIYKNSVLDALLGS